MSQLRTEAEVLRVVYEVGALAAAVDQLIMMRNATLGLSEVVVQTRVALLQPAIMVLKAQLRKDVRERLIPALEKWETFE